MAGKIVSTTHQINDSATASNNFVLKADNLGGLKLSRGNDGATSQDILEVASTGKVTLTQKGALDTIASVYNSGNQTIASATLLTLAHGLVTVPKRISSTLVCLTADNGFSTGDVLFIEGAAFNTSSGGNSGMSVYADATNVYVRFGSGLSPFCSPNKSTGVGAALTNTSWALVLEAIK